MLLASKTVFPMKVSTAVIGMRFSSHGHGDSTKVHSGFGVTFRCIQAPPPTKLYREQWIQKFRTGRPTELVSMKVHSSLLLLFDIVGGKCTV